MVDTNAQGTPSGDGAKKAPQKLGNHTSYEEMKNKPVGGGRMTKDQFKQYVEAGKKKKARDRVERAEQRSPVVRIARVAGTTFLLVGSLIIGGYFVTTSNDFDAQVSANNDKIASLQEKVSADKQNMDRLPDPQAMRTASLRATERATVIKDMQNQMSNIKRRPDGSISDEGLQNYIDLVNKSRDFYTASALNGGEFLPQGMWYTPYELKPNDQNQLQYYPLPADQWGWTTAQLLPINDDGQVPVVWEARLNDKDRTLLAWVSGIYNPETNLLNSMRKTLTHEGAARLSADIGSATRGGPRPPAPPASAEEIQKRVQDMIDNKDSKQKPSQGAPAPAPAPAEGPAPAPAPQEGR